MAERFETISIDLKGEALKQFYSVLLRIEAQTEGAYTKNDLIVDVWKNGMVFCLEELARLENANKLC